jgi:hypothetical protein
MNKKVLVISAISVAVLGTGIYFLLKYQNKQTEKKAIDLVKQANDLVINPYNTKPV